MIIPIMYSTPVGAKMSNTKTPATGSSAYKGKTKKEYIPEDPNSDPNLSDSLSSDSDSSDNIRYKLRRKDKRKKYLKHRKQDSIKLCPKLTEKLLTTAYKLKVLKFK